MPGARGLIHGQLPIEIPGRVFLRACGATALALLGRPRRSFWRVREPVNHGAVLGFLALARLPIWAGMLAVLAAGALSTEPVPQPLLAIHGYIPPPLARALSVFLVLTIPLGLPLLYFVCGLLAHLGIALTGGAPRSIGATMRATGFALAWPALFVALADFLVYTDALSGAAAAGTLLGIGAVFLWQAGFAISGSHTISWIRGLFVAAMPMAVLVAATGARWLLVMRDVPFMPAPSASPYYIP